MAKQLRLQAKIDADGRGFSNTIRKLEGQAKSFGNQLKGAIAGAFSVAAVRSFLNEMREVNNQVLTFKQTLGLSSEEIQRIDLALKRTGVATLENFKTASQNLTRALFEATKNPKSQQASFFSFLGLDPEELKQKSSINALLDVAERVTKVQNQAAKTQVSQVLLGPDSGLKLAAATAEGLRRELERLKDSPAIFDDRDLQNAKQIEDTIKEGARAAKAGLLRGTFGVQREKAGGLRDILTGDFRGGAKRFGLPGSLLGEAVTTALRFFGAKVPQPTKKPAEDITKDIPGDPILGLPPQVEKAVKKAVARNIKAATASAFTPPTDSLARIGGFVGRNQFRTENLQERTAKAAEQTAKNTGGIKAELEGGG